MINRRWFSMLAVTTLVTLRCGGARNYNEQEAAGAAGDHAAGEAGQAGAQMSANAGGGGDTATGGSGGAESVGGGAGDRASAGAAAGGAPQHPDVEGGSAGIGGESATDGGANSAGGAANRGGANTSGGVASQGGAPTCTGANACIKAPPAGWMGPVLASANAVSSCPAAFPSASVLGSAFSAGAASCSCNCGAPTVECGKSISLSFSTTSCSSFMAGTGDSADGGCRSAGGAVGMSYNGGVTQATCGAGTAVKSATPNTWGATLNVCGAPRSQGTCAGSGELCLARPTAPFQDNYCVMQAGDIACPAGYPTRSVMYAGAEDTRACPQSCSCSVASSSCSVSVSVYSQVSCAGTPSIKTVPSTGVGVCIVSSTATQNSYFARAVGTGSCAASAPVSITGSAYPTGATTVCCQQ